MAHPSHSRVPTSVAARPATHDGKALLFATLVAAVACGGPKEDAKSAEPAAAPSASVADEAPRGPTEPPPPPLESRDWNFPQLTRSHLANGLEVAVAESHALPVVQVRLLVKSGSGYGAPGVASLTAQILKEGGTRTMSGDQVLERVEALGTDLSVSVGHDATTFGLAVTRDHLAAAVDLLSEVVTTPRIDPNEWRKLRAREADAASSAAKTSGAWMASRVLFRALYPGGGPYANEFATASEIEKIDIAAAHDHYHRFFVPRNATLVVAGDVDAGDVTALVETKFLAWRGAEPTPVSFQPPTPPAGERVLFVDRPKSTQSDVYVVRVVPDRQAADWPALRVANQILGGGVSGRLFADVREARSLAYSTNSSIVELAHGQQPILLYAGTETGKTALAVEGLLDNLNRLTAQPPVGPEVDTATRYLSDVFAVRLETIGAIADTIATQDALGLPDGYWDGYRKQVREVDTTKATQAAQELVGDRRSLVVVAGDADTTAESLRRFGAVAVMSPDQDFAIVRTLSALIEPGVSGIR